MTRTDSVHQRRTQKQKDVMQILRETPVGGGYDRLGALLYVLRMWAPGGLSTAVVVGLSTVTALQFGPLCG